MAEQNLFGLNRFKVDDICDHAAICMIAKRASGKSYVVRDILKKKSDIPAAMVIAPTDKLSGFYDEFIPSIYIHYQYESDKLTQLFHRQEILIEKNKQRVKEGKTPIDTRVILVMDDCLADKKAWMKDKNIAELLQNGRHYHITFILTMQYALGITPELRSNFDYVFLLGEDFINNKKKLYEHYAGMFPSFDIFSQVFRQVTANYGSMVLNNRVKSAEIREKVFWFKADVPKDKFVIGSKEFKSYHEKKYDPEWNKKKPIIDINSLLANKRNNIKVDVEMLEDDE